MLKIPRRQPLTAHVGVLGVGHHTYWGQFEGLYAKLEEKLAHLVTKLEGFGVNGTAFGISDTAQRAYAVVPQIKSADIDVLFVDMLTYATSATIGAVFRKVDVPIVLVALQPLTAMDYYAHGSTFMQLINDDICSLPEFTGVAVRRGRQAPLCIIGMLHNDPQADAELADWCAIAHVLHDLRRARIGLMGHVLEAMLDMHTDPTALTGEKTIL